MEQRKKQEIRKEDESIEILSLMDMRLIKGGDGEGEPPPVENGDGENG